MKKDKQTTYWCKKCLVPVIGEKCYSCGQSTQSLSNTTLKPIYQNEIQYLKSIFDGRLPSGQKELEIWGTAAKNIYYFNGNPLYQICNFAIHQEGISIKYLSERKNAEPSRATEEMLAVLKAANAPYIRAIQYEAICFIREIVSKFSNKKVIVSFSGGKDSATVSHLVMSALGKSDIVHLFADTTIEAPDTYDFIATFQKEHPFTPLITCRSSMDFFETANQIGVPSRIQRWCCTTHKTNPLSKTVNAINPGGGVLAFDGVRRNESVRRSKYKKVSFKHKIGDEILVSPILEWTDFQVWMYLLYHNLSINKAYMKGFRRVGCLYCPFNSYWSERLIQHYYPARHRTWENFLYEHAKRSNHPDHKFFVAQGWRTRAGGRGLENYKTKIESFPCALSDDSYNYQLLSGEIKNVRAFLSPFGNITSIYETEYSEAFICYDKRNDEMLFSVETSFEEKSIRVSFFKVKYRNQLKKRIEKQIRKIQSCIQCGACSSICPKNANRLAELQSIDMDRCTSCLKCVSHNCPAVDSLKERGKRTINGKVRIRI
jgi:phosphoadenosine phosphosulfate reductase